MNHLKKITQEFEYVERIECDKCHKVFDETDFINWQEAVCIKMTGGYGSVFGDGVRITLDLCQHCFKELCGKFVVTT